MTPVAADRPTQSRAATPDLVPHPVASPPGDGTTVPVIEAHGLRKRFGAHEALRGIDLTVAPGQVLGLLGPNGAGKTTTVRVLTTLLRPDGGTARVAGHDVLRHPDRVRTSIGLSGQYAAVDGKLTAHENLVLVGLLYGLSRRQARTRADELLERMRLTDVARTRAATFSGGMRRRLDLAGAMVAAPPVVVLDEPTTGLDPRGRLDTWEIIGELVDAGTAVLLTTQYLEEADQLADAIAVIDAGRVIARGTADDLKRRAGGSRLELVLAPDADPAAATAALAGLVTVEPSPGARRLSAPAPGGDEDLHRSLTALRAAGVRVEEAALRRPTLDDVFLQLTGRPADDEEEDA